MGKDIGFVGDRGQFSMPSTVILHPDKTWKWVSKSMHCSYVELKKFFTNQANTYKLILLPPTLARFCAATPRTPFELLSLVTDMSANGDTGLTYENSVLLQNWCMTACHVDSGKTKFS